MSIALAMQRFFQSPDYKILHQITLWQSKALAIGLEHLIFSVLQTSSNITLHAKI
jgi:hypothetical protein